MRDILAGIRSAAVFIAGVITFAPLLLWATIIQKLEA